MKIKVNLFDRQLMREYYSILSVIGLVLSFVLIFKGVPDEHKLIAAVIFGSALVIIYIFLWIRANVIQKVIIEVNNSLLEIKVGDIFEENGLKVIAFNEYFDTIVDNKIISERSLNGLYIKNVVDDVDKKVKSLNGVFNIIDGVTDKLSALTEVISDSIILFFRGLFKKKKKKIDNEGKEDDTDE